MNRYTGLIFDLSHHQVEERLHFVEPQFVGTMFNVNGLNSIERSQSCCDYQMHFGVDLNLVGDDVDEWGNLARVPIQLRVKTTFRGGYCEEEYIDENGMFCEGMISEEDVVIEEEEEDDDVVMLDVEKEEEKVNVIRQQLNRKLMTVVFDDADDEMVNFNYVCSKWRSPGHLWVELYLDWLKLIGCFIII